MNEERILNSINSYLDQVEINLADQIKKKQIPKMLRHDRISRQKKGLNAAKLGLVLAPVAACLLLLVGLWNYGIKQPDSYVYFDVNPAISLVTNRKDQVLTLSTTDPQDQHLLLDIDYELKQLDEVTLLVVEKLQEQEYLAGNDSYMLLSVYNKNKDKQQLKQSEVSKLIKQYLLAKDNATIVLVQDLIVNDDLSEQAQLNHLSISRMTFIKNLMDLSPQLDFDNLKDMSIRDLVILTKGLGLDLADLVKFEDSLYPPELTESLTSKSELDQEPGQTQQPMPTTERPGQSETSPMPSDSTSIESLPESQPSSRPSQQQESSGPLPSETTSYQQPEMISLDRASEIALAKTGGGRIVEIQLEIKGNITEYEIEIIKDDKKYEVEIDAYTGAIIDFELEDLDPDKKDKPGFDQVPSGLISREKAEEIALAQVGGGTVLEVELEIKAHEAEYEIKILKDGIKYEVELDAYSGEVLEVDID